MTPTTEKPARVRPRGKDSKTLWLQKPFSYPMRDIFFSYRCRGLFRRLTNKGYEPENLR